MIDRDESTVRVDDESFEMSLEMSQQREPTTGARGSNARSCYDPARKTPPTSADRSISKGRAELVEWYPLTTRYLVSKGSNSRRSRKSQTCDAKQSRGDWPVQPSVLHGRTGWSGLRSDSSRNHPRQRRVQRMAKLGLAEGFHVSPSS